MHDMLFGSINKTGGLFSLHTLRAIQKQMAADQYLANIIM